MHTTGGVPVGGKDGKQPRDDDNKQHLTIIAEPAFLDPPFPFPV